MAPREPLPKHRHRPGTRSHLRRALRLGVRPGQRQAAQAARPARGGPEGAGARRDDRRRRARDQHLLQGDEAAHQDGFRLGARPAGAHARRALQRHGPASTAAADGAAHVDGRAGPYGPVQLPHPRRGGGDRRHHPGDGGRAARGVRRLPRDPPADDRAAPPIHGAVQRRPGSGRGRGRRRVRVVGPTGGYGSRLGGCGAGGARSGGAAPVSAAPGGSGGSGALHVEATDQGRFVHVLPVLAREAGISLFEVTPADESLESVFAYLVSR